MARSVTHLILPAAGLGTRMKPVDPDRPKELLPLGGTTPLGLAVREAEAAGIREVVIVLREDKQELWDYAEELDSPCSLSFAFQTEPLGEADAIHCARSAVGDSPFAVLYPDNVAVNGPGALNQLLQCFTAVQAARKAENVLDVVAITKVKPEHAEGLGNAGHANVEREDDGGYAILGFPPKGEGHFVERFPGEWRAHGLYVTGPHFFEAVERIKNEGFAGELTDGKVRRAILASGRTILGCPLEYDMLDAGNPVGYGMLRKLLG